MHLKRDTDAFGLLQGGKNVEQVFGAGISFRPKHALQAWRRNLRLFGQFGEADGRVDVIAQNGPSRRKVAVTNQLQPLSQQILPEDLDRAGRGLGWCRENPWSVPWLSLLPLRNL